MQLFVLVTLNIRPFAALTLKALKLYIFKGISKPLSITQTLSYDLRKFTGQSLRETFFLPTVHAMYRFYSDSHFNVLLQLIGHPRLTSNTFNLQIYLEVFNDDCKRNQQCVTK